MSEFLFGSLRKKISKADEGRCVSSLKEWLDYIFPGEDIVYDKPIPKAIWLDRCDSIDEAPYRAFRPDARIESRDLIIEFDGTQHYTSAPTIMNDLIRDNVLQKHLGYHVVRIPFYVQLSKDFVRENFGVEIEKGAVVKSGFYSMTDNPDDYHPCTPASFCAIGLQKFIDDMQYFLPESDVKDIMDSLTVISQNHGREYSLPYEFDWYDFNGSICYLDFTTRGLMEAYSQKSGIVYDRLPTDRDKKCLTEYNNLLFNHRSLLKEIESLRESNDDGSYLGLLEQKYKSEEDYLEALLAYLKSFGADPDDMPNFDDYCIDK